MNGFKFLLEKLTFTSVPLAPTMTIAMRNTIQFKWTDYSHGSTTLGQDDDDFYIHGEEKNKTRMPYLIAGRLQNNSLIKQVTYHGKEYHVVSLGTLASGRQDTCYLIEPCDPEDMRELQHHYFSILEASKQTKEKQVDVQYDRELTPEEQEREISNNPSQQQNYDRIKFPLGNMDTGLSITEQRIQAYRMYKGKTVAGCLVDLLALSAERKLSYNKSGGEIKADEVVRALCGSSNPLGPWTPSYERILQTYIIVNPYLIVYVPCVQNKELDCIPAYIQNPNQALTQKYDDPHNRMVDFLLSELPSMLKEVSLDHSDLALAFYHENKGGLTEDFLKAHELFNGIAKNPDNDNVRIAALCGLGRLYRRQASNEYSAALFIFVLKAYPFNKEARTSLMDLSEKTNINLDEGLAKGYYQVADAISEKANGDYDSDELACHLLDKIVNAENISPELKGSAEEKLDFFHRKYSPQVPDATEQSAETATTLVTTPPPEEKRSLISGKSRIDGIYAEIVAAFPEAEVQLLPDEEINELATQWCNDYSEERDKNLKEAIIRKAVIAPPTVKEHTTSPHALFKPKQASPDHEGLDGCNENAHSIRHCCP